MEGLIEDILKKSKVNCIGRHYHILFMWNKLYMLENF